MEAIEMYAKEFMEFTKRFNDIGFDLIGSKTNSGVKFYTVREIKKKVQTSILNY